jgi:hypothetical protein
MTVLVPPEFGIPEQNIYVLDITTGSGTSQMYLISFSPDDGRLTQGQVDDVADALQTAIEAVSGVTACDLNPMSTTMASAPFTGAVDVKFDATWTLYGYSTTVTGHPGHGQMYLASLAPGDGMLASGDVAGVAAAVQTAIEGLSGVTACSLASAPTVTPATIV